ncbi:MAG: hypothetical protein ACFFE4_05765 [Candidatus Thorarchaeota archaeon]
MRILKIADGFVTNSSTNTTTILLAVQKTKNFANFLRVFKSAKDFPDEFFDFERNSSDIHEFQEVQEIDRTHLLNDFDLFINTISHFRNNELDCEKIDQIFEFVKELENRSPKGMSVIFGGDFVHDSMYFKFPYIPKNKFNGERL